MFQPLLFSPPKQARKLKIGGIHFHPSRKKRTASIVKWAASCWKAPPLNSIFHSFGSPPLYSAKRCALHTKYMYFRAIAAGERNRTGIYKNCRSAARLRLISPGNTPGRHTKMKIASLPNVRLTQCSRLLLPPRRPFHLPPPLVQ